MIDELGAWCSVLCERLYVYIARRLISYSDVGASAASTLNLSKDTVVLS